MGVDGENDVGSDYDAGAGVGDDNHGGSDLGDRDCEHHGGAAGET